MRWPTFKLESLCLEFTDGNWVESKDQSPKGIRLIQTGNVGEGVFKDRVDKARYISEATFSRLKCFEILEGDCLISRLPDPVGRSCVLPDLSERMITAVDCTVIRFDKTKILTEYFNFYSQTTEYLETVDSHTSGATRKRISRKNLGKITVPVPSITEQKRIVAILDQAFADLEQVRAKTEQNLKNARELFDSYLQQVFSQRGEGWTSACLGDVCHIVGGGTPSKSNDDFYTGNIPWATVRDMKNERLSTTELAITDEAIKQSSTNLISSGNIIIATRVGLGKVCVLEQDTAINQDLKAIIPKTEELHNTFLYWWFKSIAHLISAAGTGATVQGVKLTFVKSLVISLPNVIEQNKIVTQLNSLSENASKLENLYETKLSALSELKKSILQKAFSGELTAKAE